jgi:hypothetical protein
MGCFRIVVTIGRTRITKCCAQEKVCNSISLNDVTGATTTTISIKVFTAFNH